MYKYIMAVLVLLIVAEFSYIAGMFNPMLSSTNNDAVLAVCEQSRLVNSGEWEEACGIAQDNTNTEFLCEARDNNPGTRCWVENKEY